MTPRRKPTAAEIAEAAASLPAKEAGRPKHNPAPDRVVDLDLTLSDEQLKLVIDGLRSELGWQVYEARLIRYRDQLNGRLLTSDADTSMPKLQRLIGELIGVNRAINEPAYIDQMLARRAAEREEDALQG